MKALRTPSLLLALLTMPLPLDAQQTLPDPQTSSHDVIWEHIETLESMISMWPKQEYYLQLASLYGRVGDFDRKLELYEISDAMGWLTETEQLIQYARLLLWAERIEEVDELLRKALEREFADIRHNTARADGLDQNSQTSEQQ